MRARHSGSAPKVHGEAKRARGGAVDHHPSNAIKHTGEGDRAKMHAARRARGGTCWYCGDSFDKGKKRGGGIHIKPSHAGLLHKNLGIAQGKPIPAKALAKAKNSSNPAVRKRAVFAENAKHWHH